MQIGHMQYANGPRTLRQYGHRDTPQPEGIDLIQPGVRPAPTAPTPSKPLPIEVNTR
jgi:hypothetical protein